jgi:hypothetical protein
MVESNPYDEEPDLDPYSQTLYSDDEAALHATVTQEDDQIGGEEDMARRRVQFTTGSATKSPTLGADSAQLAGSSRTETHTPPNAGTATLKTVTGKQTLESNKGKQTLESKTKGKHTLEMLDSGGNTPVGDLGGNTPVRDRSAGIGTLRSKLEQLGPSITDTPETEARHIRKWSNLIASGWTDFTRELVKERSRANPKPLAFAILTQANPHIQIAHGFAQMAMEQDSHPCHGVLGFFLGDRIVTVFQNEAILQDPPFVTMPETLQTEFRVKPATEGAVKKMAQGGLAKGSPKTPEAVVPFCLPLPLSWVLYFLVKPRSTREAYYYMKKKLAKWTTGSIDLQATCSEVMTWFRAACTIDPDNQGFSIMDADTLPVARDNESIHWTMAHLQLIVPRPLPRTTTPPIAGRPATAPPPVRDGPGPTAAMYERIMALSSSILTAQVERERPTETAKKLSEVEICRILGFCGLGWSERHLMPTIWADLKKQPDRPSREAVLAAFFAKLAEKDPSLRYFSNQALADDIINHRFTPGDVYETCHKGLSPLAFLPRTFADIHEDQVAEDHYNEATVKTVMDVRKHRTKGPPHIPMNDAELLRLNLRDVVILEALFTEWSALVRQEKELHAGLQDQQMELFSNPESTKEMIPNLMWAKIKARRQFFLTTCTREMLDRPEGAHPIVARANLNTHTLLFLSGTKVSIVGVPSQWLKREEQQGPAKKAKQEGTTTAGAPPADGRYGNANPWTQPTDPPSKPAAKAMGRNPAGPPIFAQSTEVNDMLRKFPKVTLTQVAVAAGLAGAAAITTTGLADNTCLLWVVFGNCPYPKCRRTHPATISTEAAANLYGQLIAGVNKLRAGTALPPAPTRA